MRPALTTTSFRVRQEAESSQLPSLATFFQCHPGFDFCSSIHCSRLPASLVREWTLARYGHHPFLDGRAARHRALHVPCLCGSDDWSLCHALRRCPIFSSLRSTWLQRLQSAVDGAPGPGASSATWSACGPNARLPPSGAPQRPHGRADGWAPYQWRCSSRLQALRQCSRAPMGARLWTASWTLAWTQGPADCPCGPKT